MFRRPDDILDKYDALSFCRRQKIDGIAVINSNGWSQEASRRSRQRRRRRRWPTMTTTKATRLLMMMMRCEETPRQLPRASFSSTASSLLCHSLSASSRFVIIVLCGFLVTSTSLFRPLLYISLFLSLRLSFSAFIFGREDSSNIIDLAATPIRTNVREHVSVSQRRCPCGFSTSSKIDGVECKTDE